MTKGWKFTFINDCVNLRGFYMVRCVSSTDYHTVGGVYILSYDE